MTFAVFPFHTKHLESRASKMTRNLRITFPGKESFPAEVKAYNEQQWTLYFNGRAILEGTVSKRETLEASVCKRVKRDFGFVPRELV